MCRIMHQLVIDAITLAKCHHQIFVSHAVHVSITGEIHTCTCSRGRTWYGRVRAVRCYSSPSPVGGSLGSSCRVQASKHYVRERIRFTWWISEDVLPLRPLLVALRCCDKQACSSNYVGVQTATPCETLDKMILLETVIPNCILVSVLVG